MSEYICYNYSEQGDGHKKRNVVCQDSSACYQNDEYKLIVVSDGHGGHNYVRSDRGSAFAVESVRSAVEGFCKQLSESGEKPDKEEMKAQLSKVILNQWHHLIANDCEKNPFTEEELSVLNPKVATSYKDGSRKERAYGATLVVFFITTDFGFGLQIGDGDCVLMDEEGNLSEPIPEDPACFLNVTTSLCGECAADQFRSYYTEELPAGVFLTTDGVRNSMLEDEKFYTLFKTMVMTMNEPEEEAGQLVDGLDRLKNEMPDCLRNISRRGNGDDVSVAMMLDKDKMKKVYERFSREYDQMMLDHNIESTFKKIKQMYIRYCSTKRDTLDETPAYLLTEDKLETLLAKEKADLENLEELLKEYRQLLTKKKELL